VLKAAGIVAAGRASPGYDHTSQAISELSARGAPSATIHRLSTATSALLQLVFAYALARRRHHLLASTFATIGVAGLGGAAFRCSPGCPPPGSDGATRSDSLHNLFGFGGGAALIAAPAFGLGLARTGRAYRQVTGVLATATIVSGAAALGGLTGSRKGLWQRVFQACSHTWQIIAACRLVALDRQSRH
jgi:hypothetical protein